MPRKTAGAALALLHTLPGASMRPRPDAAENRHGAADPSLTEAGFNEAAARCRGKRAPPAAPEPTSRGFNEAAARCRGKRAPTSTSGRSVTALQ